MTRKYIMEWGGYRELRYEDYSYPDGRLYTTFTGDSKGTMPRPCHISHLLAVF